MIEIRTAAPDDFPAIVRVLREAFGGGVEGYTDEEVENEKPTIDFDRWVVADDRSERRPVAVAGSHRFDITLPGGATVPLTGVTAVGVTSTHRRRGLLRQLLDWVHDDGRQRGEPLAGLYASESKIYSRFGYAIATTSRVVEIDRRNVTFTPRHPPAPGDVRLLGHDDPTLVDELVKRWEQFRRQTVGELSRSETWHRYTIGADRGKVEWAFHDDGFAVWQVSTDWSTVPSGHRLRVHILAASTPAARDALLATMFAHDLVGTIELRLPLDDPLPYQVDDSRVIRTTWLRDGLWLRVDDVAAVFGARTYRTDDELVIEVDGQRWTVGNGGCVAANDRDADLVVAVNAVGALVLGATSLHALAGAGRVEPRSPEVLARAELLFRHTPDASCRTFF